MRLGYFMNRQIRHLDNMYYQYELGLIDEQYMSWWRNIVRNNVDMWLELLGDEIAGRESFLEEVRRIHDSL